MGVGLTVYDVAPREFVPLCRTAELAGIDTLWLGEHIVNPVDARTAHPTSGAGDAPGRQILSAATQLLDPFAALGAASAATTRLRLGTGMFLLALRHPLATARAMATLQGLSGGRCLLGVGAGWLEEEFVALGLDFRTRYRRMEECLVILRAALRGEAFSFDGEFYSFDTVQVSTEPVDLRIVLGGNTERAMRRAVTLGDGWISSGIPSIEEAVDLASRLRAVGRVLGRDEAFEVHFRVPGCAAELVQRYRDHGIDNVVLVTAEVRAVAGEISTSTFADALSRVVDVSSIS